MENLYLISWQQLLQIGNDEYILVDIRSSGSINYGMIDNAISIPSSQLLAKTDNLPKDKLIVLYCTNGLISHNYANKLSELGFNCRYLENGYNGWLNIMMEKLEQQQDIQQRVEFALRKHFKTDILNPFVKAICDYDMIQENDKIAVCISGGKDSMLLAKCFQELKRRNKYNFDLFFLVMDPGYSPANRKIIEQNAKILGIPITILQSDIFDTVYDIDKSPCYKCARMRRGYLYRFAKENGCNKIALGHHYDDVIETTLMGMLYAGQFQTMMPKLHSDHFEGMQLIRPFYYVREADIRKWRDYHKLHFLQCACRFTDNALNSEQENGSSSKRYETKLLIKELKKENPFVESNIFKAAQNVSLNNILGYKKDGVRHCFLDDYDNWVNYHKPLEDFQED